MTTTGPGGKRVFKDDSEIKLFDPFKDMISDADLNYIMDIFNSKGTQGGSRRGIDAANLDLAKPPKVVMEWGELDDSKKKGKKKSKRKKQTMKTKGETVEQRQRRLEYERRRILHNSERQRKGERHTEMLVRSAKVVQKIRAKAISRIGLPNVIERLKELDLMREAVRENKSKLETMRKEVPCGEYAY